MPDIVAPIEVGLCCSDLDRLVQFYAELLGAKLVSVIDVPPEKAREAALSSSGYKVARVQLPTGERIKFLQPLQAPRRQAPSEDILERRNTTYLTFIVDELSTVLGRLEAAGGQLLTGPDAIAIRPGVSIVFARDPEQNLIEFVRHDDVKAYRQPQP